MDNIQIPLIIYAVIGLYGLCLLGLSLYSLGQLHLVWHYLRPPKKDKALQTPEIPESEYPFITIQLPVYNEKYVIERLLQSVSALEYPKGKWEIQLLDDSTDETTEIAAQCIEKIANGNEVPIHHIRRPKREGFKAGALQYGLQMAKGQFIAIFDADFLPEKDFLIKTIPHFFASKDIGVVQTRWGHVNRNYSWLTQLQAFGLDAHFTIEQLGRNKANSFINFNGTAGVWRKKCIESSGGWQPDTLTEDLDLSYRAQLNGWHFRFLEEVVTPAELPVLISAIKSQQYRWNKGAAESARKHLKNIFISEISFQQKLHAFLHLLNSSVFVLLIIAGLLSVPLIIFKQEYQQLKPLINWGSLFLIGFFSIGYFYWQSSKRLFPSKKGKYFFTHFPLFLIVSMGLSLHNGWAVIEGWIGFKTPFIRTPKFNVVHRENTEHVSLNQYVKFNLSWQNFLEILFCLYYLTGFAYGIYVGDGGMLLFHGMLTLGFGWIAWESIRGAISSKSA